MTETRGEGAVARVSRAVLGASLMGVVLSALDAHWARTSAAEPPSFGATFLADLGLVAPLAVAVGIGVGGVSLFLHPARAPSARGLGRWLNMRQRRAYAAAVAPLAALATAAWIVGSAGLALPLLASDTPDAAAGAALGLLVVLLALLGGSLVLGGSRALAVAWSQSPPNPLITGAVGLALALGLLGYAIASGSTSGAGGTLALFGVFKRPELDLRAPASLLLMALAAYAGPAALARVPAIVAALLGVLPLVFCVHAAGGGLADRRVALAVERGAPLGKRVLGPARKLGDRDKDGYSGWFGGGDCDESNAAVNPGADDVPGNGADEDCSGSDAKKVDLGKDSAPEPKNAEEYVEQKLPKRMNVVLLTIDTLRYDVGYAGNPRPITPNIDKLAKKSVVFSKAYALGSYTAKSLPPMLIGKYPSETHRGWSHFNRFGTQDTFIQTRLQKAGIRTISVQGYWYFFNKGYGFERGFDVIDSSGAPKHIQLEGDKSFNADKVSDAAIAQLKKPENTKDPFFMWVHYVDPHTEYVRHEEFDFGPGSRERYDSEVAFVDKHAGRIIDHVLASSYADRTAIIVTSDHGEAFGEHGMIRHGFEVWEELVRVPLLFYVPSAPPHRVKKRRGIIDVVPTILDLYRLPKPKGEGTDFISGETLIYDIFMPPGHQPEKRIVFVDMSAGPNNAERQAFIENDMKLIASGGRPISLYDLEKDPEEKHDLLDEPGKAGEIVDRYKAFRRELREVVVRPIPK